MIVFSDVHGHCGLLDGWPGPFACAGDVLGSGGGNETCVDLLRERKVATVRGNHDEDPRLRVYLTPGARAWMDALPTACRHGDVVVTHTLVEDGSYRDVDSFEAASALLSEYAARVVFVGHTHLPGWWRDGIFHPSYGCESFRLDGPAVINVGSLGEPCSPQRASFVRFSDEVVAFGRL